MDTKAHSQKSARKTGTALIGTMPTVLGVLLLASLVTAFLSNQFLAATLSIDDLEGTVAGALVGSIAAGNPITSYVLGGELLAGGAGLVPVTALIASWVTVGVVQLPAEIQSLGKRFAICRNALCFGAEIAVAYLTVLTAKIVN